MERSFLDYAMSVIMARALPDVRDGLKPVHRRIIWDMEQQGFRPDRPFVKCARVTGDTMAKFHPHGRQRHLRRAGAHGPALLAAPPAHRLPRQLRLARLRPGGRALHGVPAAPAGHAAWWPTSTRTPSTSSPTTTAPTRSRASAGPLPQPARQRQPGHRRGHGHQHPAPQPGRGHRRHGPPHRAPRRHPGRPHAVRQGSGLPDRRLDHGPGRDHGGLPHRAGQREDAGQGHHRGSDRRGGRWRSSSPSCRTR